MSPWGNKNSIWMTDLPNIVFFGSDEICLPFLNYIHNEGASQCRLRAVISQPDRRQGRGKKLQQNPVAAWATEHGFELLQPEKPTRDLAEWLIAEQTAVAFVMAYGHFLPKSLREAPMHGMVNFHGSLLPKYRGASPVETALALGESEAGVALMQVVKEMDAGGVADVESVCIEKSDTGPSLRAKIGEAVVPLMQRNLAATLAGELEFEPQDVSQATFCRKISKDDAALDFTQSANSIDARLRAFTPWPGGYFDHGDVRIKVGRVEPTSDDAGRACGPQQAGTNAEGHSIGISNPSSRKPGTVLDCTEGVLVATGEGLLRILELQRPGGKMLPAKDFLRGYEIQPGECLPSVPQLGLLVD